MFGRKAQLSESPTRILQEVWSECSGPQGNKGSKCYQQERLDEGNKGTLSTLTATFISTALHTTMRMVKHCNLLLRDGICPIPGNVQGRVG